MLSSIKNLLVAIFDGPPNTPTKDPQDELKARLLSSTALDSGVTLLLRPSMSENAKDDMEKFREESFANLIRILNNPAVNSVMGELVNFHKLLGNCTKNVDNLRFHDLLIVHRCPYYKKVTNTLWTSAYFHKETKPLKRMTLILDKSLIGVAPTIPTGNGVLSEDTSEAILHWLMSLNLNMTDLHVLNKGNTVIVKADANGELDLLKFIVEFKEYHNQMSRDLTRPK